MKVLITSFGRFHTFQMVDSLKKWNIEVNAIICDYKQPTVNRNSYKFFKFLRYFFILSKLPFQRYSSFIKTLSFKAFDYFVGFYIKRQIDIDIVHSYSLYALKTFKAAKTNKVIKILERAGSHPSYQKKVLEDEYKILNLTMPSNLRNYLEFEKRMIEEIALADYIVTCSDYSKSTFILEGVDSSKIKVIPLGTNELNIKNVKKNPKFKILFVGSQPIIKGLHYFLEAISLIKHDIDIVIVSNIDDDFYGQHKHLLNKKNIVCHKKLNWDMLAIEYASSHLFCLPSIDEAYGMVVFEAISFGIPVVVTDTVGACEEVAKHRYGLVSKSKDSIDLFQKLNKLISDNILYEELSQNCLTAKNVNSWLHYGNELKLFYDGLLK